MEDNKHLTEEEIAFYADAIICGNMDCLSKKIIEHVQNCDECAEKVLMVTSILGDAIENKESTVIKKINFFRKKNIFRIAASVILIFGGGIIYQQIKQTKFLPSQKYSEIIDSTSIKTNNSDVFTEPIIKKKSSKNKIKKLKRKAITHKQNTKLLAYTENNHLEKLVSRFNETSLRDNFSINAKPIIELNNKTTLVLEIGNNDKEILIINFFDNKGNKMFADKFSEKNYKTKKIKKPGLYYWKLLSEDYDLLFCGKIIIK